MSQDILVVDDESDIRELISDILKDEGFTPRVANDSCSTFQAIDERLPSAMILDIWLQNSKLDGIEILEKVKRQYPDLPIIMISGHGNIETAINSIRLGAYDFIEKPFKEDKLLVLLNRAIETAQLKQENQKLKERGAPETELIGSSLLISQLRNSIDKLAQTSSRVLIKGPAGCGKEVIARFIHKKSRRATGPFEILNAASISPDRVEEELFGIEENNESGKKAKIGTFERAHNGTLFIDEVSDMPLSVQGKLLRLLQENSFERLGSNKKVKVDVRVIASTNKDLQKEITNGNFREDLYYRLNVVPLNVPPLNNRKEDIPELVSYFVIRCANILGVPPRTIPEQTIAAMQGYEWPGNVRQLRNVIEWLLIMAPEDQSEKILPSMLPPDIISNAAVKIETDNNADIMGLALRDARELFEKQYLSAQLNRFGGNVSKTAAAVGMERSAFHRKLKCLNINEHIQTKNGESE